MINFKHGAMFGLDARIALAIFGALSVISGAAMFSAIQDAKTTAILTEMDNIGKGVTAFYLDTGVYPTPTYNSNLTATQLTTDSGIPGWRGPYLPFEDGTTSPRLKHTLYGEISLQAREPVEWMVYAATIGDCTQSSPLCNIYVCFHDMDADMLAVLNEKVDGNEGSSGFKNGKFRSYTSVAVNKTGCLSVLPFPPSSSDEI